MKKIWLFCLCLAVLGLVGCFHVPDEDWLPSKNKVKTEDVKNEDVEIEQAINSLVEWFNMASTERNNMKNKKSDETDTEEWNENIENIEEVGNEINENTENGIISEIDKNKSDTGDIIN